MPKTSPKWQQDLEGKMALKGAGAEACADLKPEAAGRRGKGERAVGMLYFRESGVLCSQRRS